MYEQHFPNLEKEGYKITSDETVQYNCIAWAAGDNDRWWWPDNLQSYWPDEIPNQNTMEAFITMFCKFGYSLCDNYDLENGYEKVAIYANEKGVTHAARQLTNGRWTSKLGQSHDIEHTLAGLNSDAYGTVQQILKRKIN